MGFVESLWMERKVNTAGRPDVHYARAKYAMRLGDGVRRCGVYSEYVQKT